MASHEDTVQEQFDPQSQAYLHSAVHAQGPDLARAQSLVARTIAQRVATPGIATPARALDVGCGAGHLSFMLTGCVARVVAVDPSAGMLATVEHSARARGLSGIETRQASAGSLPFADESFDLVGTRYSAHHWHQLERALQELHRVLKPAGHLLIIDVEGHEDPLVDTHLQTLELVRDRSHVRNRSVREWQRLLAQIRFEIIEHQRWPLQLLFAPWVQRMRTSPERVQMIRTLQLEAPAEVQQALAYEPDGSFTVHTSLFWAARVT